MAKRIVIIGGGPAGYEAAFAGKKYGAEVTLVEDRGAGGSAVLYDCVPSKSLIAATGIRTDLRRADDMGFDYEKQGHFLEIGPVMARVRELARAQSNDVRAQLEKEGTRIINGHGYFKEAPTSKNVHAVHVDLADGTEEVIECDLVLIATGAHPRVLPGAEPDDERILSWRQVYDLTELPEHLIVVGSGVTGAEFVSAFAELGVKVTMCASRDRILPHDDADAADTLETVLSERGVHLEKNCRVSSITRTENGGVKVCTQDGREILGSHALLTVGSIPNTKDLGLEAVGIEVTKSGRIHVDRVSRTNISGIYAAGDCTDLFPLASVAAMQGRIAMYHALGEGVEPIRLKTVATAVFTRPEIAAVGVTEKQIEEQKVTARIVMLPLNTNARAKMRSIRYGFVKLFCRRNSGQIIGGVIVAPNASELITTVAVAVSNRLTVADLADSFAVYPTLSGSITEAARQLVKHDDLD